MPLAPGEVDFVLLTHAHIDHSGRLPLLAKNGFHGTICATMQHATSVGLCCVTARTFRNLKLNGKTARANAPGRDPIEPLYTVDDAETAIGLLSPFVYNQVEQLCDGIAVRFVDVGHLLGSASIEVWVTEDGNTTKIVFSGDIGNLNQPLLRDPAYITDADYIVVESTYGNRLHEPPPDYSINLAQIIQRTFDRGGNVVIPSFAVGRTQEMLYFLRDIKARGLSMDMTIFLSMSTARLLSKRQPSFRKTASIALTTRQWSL